MKSFLAGVICTIIVGALYYAITASTCSNGSTLIYKTSTKKLDDGRFEVFRDEEILFSYSVSGNGFGINVPSNRLGEDDMYYSKSDQGERGMSYSLNTTRMLKDGNCKFVVHNMDTGEIDAYMISTPDGIHSSFDGSGNPVAEKR